jgi:arabinogalactan endo-1,4-beta-galactosidase
MRFSLSALLLCITASHALTWHGADFSSVANLESAGRVYRDNGVVTKLETILANHGTNLARIRIWTSTSNSQYSLAYGLALAKRAVAARMSLLIDLHYSDICRSNCSDFSVHPVYSVPQGRTRATSPSPQAGMLILRLQNTRLI